MNYETNYTKSNCREIPEVRTQFESVSSVLAVDYRPNVRKIISILAEDIETDRIYEFVTAFCHHDAVKKQIKRAEDIIGDFYYEEKIEWPLTEGEMQVITFCIGSMDKFIHLYKSGIEGIDPQQLLGGM